jgi:hypothetical protein
MKLWIRKEIQNRKKWKSVFGPKHVPRHITSHQPNPSSLFPSLPRGQRHNLVTTTYTQAPLVGPPSHWWSRALVPPLTGGPAPSVTSPASSSWYCAQQIARSPGDLCRRSWEKSGSSQPPCSSPWVEVLLPASSSRGNDLWVLLASGTL